jgi:hypothetical protein
MRENYLDHLVGKSVISADKTTGEMLLSDGSKLIFDRTNDDCCSWIALSKMRTTEAMILSAEERDTDEGEGGYTAWVHVVTEAGELNLVEADADASNGYYLHGFALGVKVVPA